MSAPKPSRGGAAGMLFLFAAVIGGAGLTFDLLLNHQRGFWIGAEPGARALIGVGAAVIVVAAAHLLRLALARPIDEKGGKGGDQP